MEDVTPCGLIEEHDGRIVDQLQSDGQSFTLTAGETAGARLSTFQEAQSRQNLIHLTQQKRHVNMGRLLHWLQLQPEVLEEFFFFFTISHDYLLDLDLDLFPPNSYNSQTVKSLEKLW